jgi:hypothetical protein
MARMHTQLVLVTSCEVTLDTESANPDPEGEMQTGPSLVPGSLWFFPL